MNLKKWEKVLECGEKVLKKAGGPPAELINVSLTCTHMLSDPIILIAIQVIKLTGIPLVRNPSLCSSPCV